MDGPLPLPRRPLAMVGAACLVSTVALGALLGPGDGAIGIDAWAWEAADWPPLWRVLNLLLFDRAWVTFGSLFSIGTPGVTVALGVGLAVTHWWRGDARAAATCLLAPVAAVALAGVVFKPLFDRTHKGGLVYPSTHATAALAAGTLLVVLAYRSGGARRALAAAGLWAVVVFVVVLYLLEGQLHYLTDVVGGVGVGVGAPLLVVAAILGRPPARRGRRAR